ncbi:MAG: TrmH family RNA methyltransferase [Cyclobacteriaceae bacterium]
MRASNKIEIIFVLVEAARPENVGLATRGIKTLGFNSLRLVNCSGCDSEKAFSSAYASQDVLKSAKKYSSLNDALTDIDLSIGTSAKKRISRHDIFEATELHELISQKTGALKKVAIVFGSEEHGLTKEQLDLCDLVSTIPLVTTYPSLNLAQAVLIYAYELSKFNIESSNGHIEIISSVEQKAVKTKAVEMLDKLGVTAQPSLYQRLKDRLMTAGADDIRLLLALTKYIDRILKK